MHRSFFLLLLVLGSCPQLLAQIGFSNFAGPSFGSPHGIFHRIRRPALEDQYNLAKAAGKNRTYFYRMEHSVGYTLAPGTFEHSYKRVGRTPDEAGFDTAYTAKGVGKGGLYITSASGFPLVTLNRISAVLITYGGSLRLNRFVSPVMKFDGLEETYKIKTIDWAGSLTLDYKSGAEAMLDRALRTSFTIGAGIEPTWFQAEIRPTDGKNQFVVMPLVKIEFGMAFAKQVLKLRLSGNPGKKLVYYESTGNWYHSNLAPSDFRLTGSGQYALSLVWMAFAPKWEEAAWYR